MSEDHPILVESLCKSSAIHDWRVRILGFSSPSSYRPYNDIGEFGFISIITELGSIIL